MLREAFAASVVVGTMSCGGQTQSLNATPTSCPTGRTLLDGVCVNDAIADYVGCVRAQGAQLGGERAQKISAEAGTAGLRAGGAAEVRESLARKYETSDANALEIIRTCAGSLRVANTSNAKASGSGSSEPLACPEEMVAVPAPNGERLCVDRTEVTAKTYATCVNAGACTPAATQENAPGRPELVGRPAVCNYGRPDRQNHPINCVRWDQAQSYCAWAGKRLPTQQEWVFTATGGPNRFAYVWGNAPPADDQLCWRVGTTCVVGSRPKGSSPSGIHDLAGNVWEMTSSRSGLHIVACGQGFYGQTPDHVLASVCGDGDPAVQFHDLGFRCVK